MIVSTKNAVHYQWGELCDGWHLCNSDLLSMIQERMPPGTEEKLHLHQHAQQIFYILFGEAVFTVDGNEYLAKQGDSLHILPGQIHRISNRILEDLHFLVVSQPRSHGDRINIE